MFGNSFGASACGDRRMIGRSLIKAVREISPSKEDSLLNKIYLSDAFDPFHKAYVKVCVFFECVERFFYWGWKLRKSYDFDSAFVFEMLLLKYTRIYAAMENGSCDHSPAKMFKLRIIIALLKRIDANEYFSEEYQKYGGAVRILQVAYERENKDKQLLFKMLAKYNDLFWD